MEMQAAQEQGCGPPVRSTTSLKPRLIAGTTRTKSFENSSTSTTPPDNSDSETQPQAADDSFSELGTPKKRPLPFPPAPKTRAPLPPGGSISYSTTYVPFVEQKKQFGIRDDISWWSVTVCQRAWKRHVKKSSNIFLPSCTFL